MSPRITQIKRMEDLIRVIRVIRGALFFTVPQGRGSDDPRASVSDVTFTAQENPFKSSYSFDRLS